MNINFEKLTEWQRYYIIHVIIDLDKEQKEAYFSQYKNNSGNIELSFKIDGFETDPLSVINRFEEVFEEEVNKRAKILISEKLDSMFDEIDNYKEIRIKLEKGLCDKLGIQYKEDWE